MLGAGAIAGGKIQLFIEHDVVPEFRHHFVLVGHKRTHVISGKGAIWYGRQRQHKRINGPRALVDIETTAFIGKGSHGEGRNG